MKKDYRIPVINTIVFIFKHYCVYPRIL